MTKAKWYIKNEDGSFCYVRKCKKCKREFTIILWTDRIGSFYHDYRKKTICHYCQKGK